MTFPHAILRIATSGPPPAAALLCALRPFPGVAVTVVASARFGFDFVMTRLPAGVSLVGEAGTPSRGDYDDLYGALGGVGASAAPFDVRFSGPAQEPPRDGSTLQIVGDLEVFRTFAEGRLLAELRCRLVAERGRFRADCEGVAP